MISYRPYRNPDPPALVEVWNEAATGRGAYPVRTAMLFDRWIFSKPFFDPQGLIVAIDDDTNKIVGFSLADFGPTEDLAAQDPARGIIACVLVRPGYRRRGIGRELLRRAGDYLTHRGATAITIGAQRPNNPYLFGLYGGGNSPGILDSDADAAPFLTTLGYAPQESMIVFQRKLDQPINTTDSRLAMLRKRYDVQLLKAAVVGSWWQECVWSALDPAEFRAIDKLTGMPAARATAWELEGFGWKWNYPSAGIIDVQVRPDLRKQGLAKMLVNHILRFLQDQFFGIAELQVSSDDAAGAGLCRSVGFEQVDVGRVWRTPADSAPPSP